MIHGKRNHRVITDKTYGDHVCEMVLELVTKLVADQRGTTPDVVKGVEPTGVAVAPEMRPFVEQRSDRRKRSTGARSDGRRIDDRKAS